MVRYGRAKAHFMCCLFGTSKLVPCHLSRESTGRSDGRRENALMQPACLTYSRGPSELPHCVRDFACGLGRPHHGSTSTLPRSSRRAVPLRMTEVESDAMQRLCIALSARPLTPYSRVGKSARLVDGVGMTSFYWFMRWHESLLVDEIIVACYVEIQLLWRKP